MKGLGDLVAKGAKALGFEQKPGCGCAKRQEILNRWVPFGKGDPELRQPRVKSYDAITARSVISSRGAKFGPYVWTTRKAVWPIAGGSGNEEPACADPNVVLCDNFEDRSMGTIYTNRNPGTNFFTTLNSKTLGWGVNQVDPGVHQDQFVTNSGCQDGGKCFAQVYQAAPNGSDNAGGGFIGSGNFGPQKTTYIRLWTFLPSTWTAGAQGSKYIYHGDGGGDARQLLDIVDGTGFFMEGDHGGRSNLTANMNLSQANLPINQWFCSESRVTYETTTGDPATGAGGTRDGYIQLWLNDVQIFEYPNIQVGFVQGAHPAPLAMLLSAYENCLPASTTNCLDPINTHPEFTRLTDRIIVSRARIGCGAGTPPPPQQPTITISGPTSNPTYLTRTSPL